MIITDFTAQVRNPNRINVSVDGKFSFGLDISQVIDFGLKVGQEIDQTRYDFLKVESAFGKFYQTALEYSLIRPRSERELRDYLWRKSRPTISKTGNKIAAKPLNFTDRVMSLLTAKGYLDDHKFCQYWVNNRLLKKGISRRKLEQELFKKGVDRTIVAEVLAQADRNDETEIQKIIAKKRSKYDNQKLISYLVRQGFNYYDAKEAVGDDSPLD